MEPTDKELLQRNYELALETNKMVHKMRRSQNWGRFIQVVWWLAIIAISAGAYYYYLQPYVNQLLVIYSHIQAGGAQAQNVSTEISNFFGNFVPHVGSTGTTTPK